MEQLNDKWFRIIGVPAISIIATSLFFVIGAPIEIVVKSYIYGVVDACLLWETSRLCIIKIRRWLPRLEHVYKRFGLTVLCTIVNTILMTFLIQYVANSVNYYGRPITLSDDMENMTVAIAFAVTMTTIYEGIYLFKKWRQAWLDNLLLKRENLQRQLDALKTQISPSFLFQSLNSLSLLIDEDKKKAVRFVDELASVYQYLLKNHERDTLSLAEELRFTTAYFDIIKIRFGSGIQLVINVAEPLKDWHLPPMTLKTLLENAISLNKIAENTPLSIFVSTDAQNNLVFSHNVQNKTLLLKRKHLALINLSAKYKLLTDKDIDIIENDQNLSIKLILIKPVI